MERLVTLYKALGDPNRLNILQMLSGQEMSVCEVMHGLSLSQPAVSHHLKILRQAGLVESKKLGKLVLYTLKPCGLKEINQFVGSHLGELLRFANHETKPSALRDNPNYCELVGLNRSICEKDE